MKTITIPKFDYAAFVSAKQDLEDIITFDRAINDTGDSLPHQFMFRLIEGDNPLSVFRNWRGNNQSQLARISEVNRVQIADIESGRKTGSVKTLKKLAGALAG
jgi:mRNA interferase RelE/StbE